MPLDRLNWKESENEYSLRGIHLPFAVKIKRRDKSADPKHDEYFIAHVNGFVGDQVKTFKEAEIIAISEVDKLLSDSLHQFRNMLTEIKSTLARRNSFETLLDIIVKHTAVSRDKITLKSDMQRDLGMDSSDVIEFLIHLENDFDISIEDDEYLGLDTIGEWIEVINKRI